MNKRENERLTKRNYNLEIRTADTQEEQGIIEGVPIVFNKETLIRDLGGDFYETIEPTALDNTDLKDVLLFVNHDTQKIALARSKNGKGTMSFEIKKDGLHFRAKLDIENNSEARSLYSAIKRGDMDGMSFMFRVKKDEWRDIDSKQPKRLIKDISIIHEISVVNFPAYQDTSVQARSVETENILEETRASLKEARLRDKKLVELEKLKYKLLLGVKNERIFRETFERKKS